MGYRSVLESGKEVEDGAITYDQFIGSALNHPCMEGLIGYNYSKKTT